VLAGCVRSALSLVCAAGLGLAFVSPLQWAQAHEHHAPKHSSDVFTLTKQHAPTPLPDRVVLTWSDDPTKTANVTWRTAAGTYGPRAEYAPADSLRGNLITGYVPHALKVEGNTSPFASNLGSYLVHSVKLKGLKPNTMYAYRVGDGHHWSEWHQFRTASKEPTPFSFVYFGDAQNAVRSMWSRVIREANQHAPRAAFMLHAGDLVNSGDNDAEWGEWFQAGGWLNGMIPTVAAPGNHEYPDSPEGTEDHLTTHWRPQFAFPLNGPEGLEETTYWFDYQGARIISLNSNERQAEQAAWLDSLLQDQDRPKWTIVTFHHPIYSAAKERDNPQLRSLWGPILERRGVDLVLQGHDHAYARSGLGGPKNNVAEGVRNKASNTVYVVSVSGPKMYTLQEKWEVSRVASGIQLFQVIHVSPEGIRYEARTASGERYDGFTLTKDEAGVSTLTEEIPATAEVRE
jgi:hypothetical protein